MQRADLPLQSPCSQLLPSIVAGQSLHLAQLLCRPPFFTVAVDVCELPTCAPAPQQAHRASRSSSTETRQVSSDHSRFPSESEKVSVSAPAAVAAPAAPAAPAAAAVGGGGAA